MNETSPLPPPRLRALGRQPYAPVWQAMRSFTDRRDAEARDEIWWLEHDPVFTQGMKGRAEHLLAPGDIPVVQTDRGGQVTYHGPGQLVVYPLLDLRRLHLGPRGLVTRLESAVIDCLSEYAIAASARRDAPGVYVGDRKIASLGLRVRRGCSYHGVALNVAMDLEPFSRVNPCGYAGLRMTQVSDLGGPADVATVAQALLPHLLTAFALPMGDMIVHTDPPPTPAA